MQEVIAFIKENKNTFIEELKEFLRIPSISALPEFRDAVYDAAQFTANKLKAAGLNKVEVIKTEGHPLVYGEWMGAPKKPTMLIYGHYDVQPVDPLNEWDTEPFEPVVKGNKIYGRGTTDDKGQLYMHIKSVESFFKTVGSLPLNVKFLLEGEEEIGSEQLEKYIGENKEQLKCDCILVSDTCLFAPGLPTITYGLRGLAYFEIEVSGPNSDKHSGDYGGAIANPINVLAKIISQLHDKNGKITIPKFYDNVVPLSKKERDNYKELKFSEKNFAKEIGVKELTGEEGYSTIERIWARPSLDCNGIVGGFTGTGAKTVIPSKASAKISMRLVPNQDPDQVSKQFVSYIKSLAPKSVKVTVTPLHGGHPVLAPLNHSATAAAAKAMEKAFNKKTVFIRDGGSIPVIATFSKKLKAPTIMMGLGLNTENLHAPNEHFDLNHFMLGIESSAYFLDEFAKK